MFSLGKIVATPGFIQAIEGDESIAASFLERHLRLEQGELCEEDQKTNCEAVIGSVDEDGDRQLFRILSCYKLENDTRFYIITEADRSVTTFLLSSEY